MTQALLTKRDQRELDQATPTYDEPAPPEDCFRPGDEWLSPRGIQFTVLNRYRYRGGRRRGYEEIALRSHDTRRLQWRPDWSIGSGGNTWTRLSWGGLP